MRCPWKGSPKVVAGSVGEGEKETVVCGIGLVPALAHMLFAVAGGGVEALLDGMA